MCISEGKFCCKVRYLCQSRAMRQLKGQSFVTGSYLTLWSSSKAEKETELVVLNKHFGLSNTQRYFLRTLLSFPPVSFAQLHAAARAAYDEFYIFSTFVKYNSSAFYQTLEFFLSLSCSKHTCRLHSSSRGEMKSRDRRGRQEEAALSTVPYVVF